MFFPNKAVCPCAHADTTAPELVGTRRESELALELAKALGVLNLLPPTNSTTGAAHAKKKTALAHAGNIFGAGPCRACAAMPCVVTACVTAA